VAYETIARLGRGGMGVVDLARDPEGNQVALKRLTLHGSANDIYRARQRLLREADVLRRLHHPNVVRLLDVLDEGDEIVLVMPYLPGGNLAERVEQHGPAPADEVERQARHLFAALAQAHRAGIVHRDLKPANILFDERGEPCLVDFGVAHSWDQTHGLTVSGMVVGTPGFMSPEQARGDTVTPASDVFSLGATLLFAATGEGPFGPGEPGLLMVRAAAGKVEKVPKHLPGSLRRLLRATLDTRPERRPTAEQIMAGPGNVPVPMGNRTRNWAILGAFVVSALVGAGAATVVSDGGDAGDRASVDATGPGATDPGTGDGSSPSTTSGATPTTSPCSGGTDDYDEDPSNGCEAVPDDVDGTVLVDEIRATIIPRDDMDVYPIEIEQSLFEDCDVPLRVTLDAPRGMPLRLVVRSGSVIHGESTASSTRPATVTIGPERCDPEVGSTTEAEVTAAGTARSASPYVLRFVADG
jgi:hypothetical protein